MSQFDGVRSLSFGPPFISREPAQQLCPWLKKIALAAPAITRSKSASGRMIAGDFRPSSSDTFFRLPAACLHDQLADFRGAGECELAAR
jgi:hypothetical protein